MKVIAINGSPRKNWNTDTLIKKAIEGAESVGASTEIVYLYDLKFRGCIACMSCKLKSNKNLGRCVLKDDLKPVLDKLHEADVVILGSPIYWHNVTGTMRLFLERFLFQYLNYNNNDLPLSPSKKIFAIYTMNMPEQLQEQYGYNKMFNDYENLFKHFFKHCEILHSAQTLFVKDYSKYELALMNEEEAKKRHETVFKEHCQKAFEIGARLAKV